MKVRCLDETKYIYAPNVREHVCEFNISITNLADGNREVYSCVCGKIEEKTSGMKNTSILVGGAVVASDVIAVAAALYLGYKGVRIASEYIIPVMINEAGALISVASDELSELFQKNNKSNSDNPDKEGKYYPVVLIKSNEDSIYLPNLTKSLTLKEACKHVDSVLALNGAFGSLGQFVKNNELNADCSIYTLDYDSAVDLCEALVGCPKNILTKYGSHKAEFLFEMNSGCKLDGTYKHFHVFDSLGRAAVTHVLYGPPLQIIPTT